MLMRYSSRAICAVNSQGFCAPVAIHRVRTVSNCTSEFIRVGINTRLYQKVQEHWFGYCVPCQGRVCSRGELTTSLQKGAHAKKFVCNATARRACSKLLAESRVRRVVMAFLTATLARPRIAQLLRARMVNTRKHFTLRRVDVQNDEVGAIY